MSALQRELTATAASSVARTRLEDERARRSRQANQAGKWVTYQVGDRVLYRHPQEFRGKNEPPWQGVYQVESKKNDAVMWVRAVHGAPEPLRSRGLFRVHVGMLKAYHPTLVAVDREGVATDVPRPEARRAGLDDVENPWDARFQVPAPAADGAAQQRRHPRAQPPDRGVPAATSARPHEEPASPPGARRSGRVRTQTARGAMLDLNYVELEDQTESDPDSDDEGSDA